jgi:16S rRNA (adenine1518-N6/adenine1519-N6)-dimethyltransferase
VGTERVFRHKKSLGQNFLADERVLEKIAKRAAIRPSDIILEIGPGKGVLTRKLLASGCSFLHSVEIDRDLGPFLEDLENGEKNRFWLHWGDAMEMNFAGLSPAPSKVVANIPYHITTPLIWKLLETVPSADYLLLMVQKEAAARIGAPAGTKDRGPLGATLEAMGSAKILFTVPAGAFRPAPAVDSCLFEIHLVKRRGLARNSLWRDMLKYGFGRRRKKALGNLAASLPRAPWRELFVKNQIDVNSRAEALSSDEWFALMEGAEKSMASPPEPGEEATEKLKVQSIQPYP